jgi:hypothetical protein
MDDLRPQEQKKINKKRRWKIKLYLFWRKRKWWIFLSILLLIIIFFPESSGQTIGQWIHDFVGNLIKYSKF